MGIDTDRIQFTYSIELWRSRVPLSRLSKRRLKAAIDVDSCVLVIGGVRIARGHIQDGRFVIDRMIDDSVANDECILKGDK